MVRCHNNNHDRGNMSPERVEMIYSGDRPNACPECNTAQFSFIYDTSQVRTVLRDVKINSLQPSQLISATAQRVMYLQICT